MSILLIAAAVLAVLGFLLHDSDDMDYRGREIRAAYRARRTALG